MREILFRGKRLDNQQWVEGDLLNDHFANKTYIHFYEPILGCYAFEVDPATVGQYTGLLDRKLNKIFEGDIIKAWSDEGHEYAYPLPVVYEIMWAQFIACDKPRKHNFNIWLDFGEVEVIGTVHDVQEARP